jgi:hypothetical protein
LQVDAAEVLGLSSEGFKIPSTRMGTNKMLKRFWNFFAHLFGGYERGFKILLLTFAIFVFYFGGLNMLMYAGISILVACIVVALIGGSG